MRIDLDTILGLIKYQWIRFNKKKCISGEKLIRFSKSATIKTGKGSRVNIGHKVSLGKNTVVSATENAMILIGAGTGLNYNTVVIAREKITIGKDVLIGPNVAIYDHNHIFNQRKHMKDLGYKTSPIFIGDNVWIGANVVILKGVTIGSGSVISAGTIVTQNIPPNSLVSGCREMNIQEIIYKREEQ